MRTIEATRRRSIKRIARLEERQKHFVDRIVFEELSESKIKELKRKVEYLSKAIKTTKNVLKYGCRQSRGKK